MTQWKTEVENVETVSDIMRVGEIPHLYGIYYQDPPEKKDLRQCWGHGDDHRAYRWSMQIDSRWSQAQVDAYLKGFRGEPFAKKRWKVECNFFSGWDDAGWTESGQDGVVKHARFETEESANREIAEFIADQHKACDEGDMQGKYDRNDYRAVSVEEE